jgi:hypothetical protein
MNMQRHFAVSFTLVIATAGSAILAFAALVMPTGGWSSALSAEARSDTPQPDRRDFERQLESLREMHRKMRSATSIESRNALLNDSARIMSDGVSMMQGMKSGLPTTSTGEPLSNTITESEFEKVRDFMLLMDLLVQLKRDQDAFLGPDQDQHREPPPPMKSLAESGSGGSAPALRA